MSMDRILLQFNEYYILHFPTRYFSFFPKAKTYPFRFGISKKKKKPNRTFSHSNKKKEKKKKKEQSRNSKISSFSVKQK